MSAANKRLLVITDWYEPGYKAGGPIRAIVNLAQQLKNDLDVLILTTDRDLGDVVPYENITTNTWVQREPGIKVFYASPGWMSYRNIIKEINAVKPNVVFLNSMFSRYFSLYPLIGKRLGKIQAGVMLSPRGMLKETALRFKKRKKKVFLRMFRMLGLHRNIGFHGTDATEMNDIKKFFGDVRAVMAPDSLPVHLKPFTPPPHKQPGQLTMLFVGRVHRIKNIDFLIDALRNVKASVELGIIASIEDKDYWQQCQSAIETLPQNIRVHMYGEMPNEQVEQRLLATHIFVLPTRGENFGHAIFESLAAGRPVLISDQTPWRNLESQKAGWDLPLQQEKFTEIIERAAAMNTTEMNEWCGGAWNFCKRYIESSGIKEQYLKLFS
jgi:glycosyltransferase involved in cell wall biosynthesis